MKNQENRTKAFALMIIMALLAVLALPFQSWTFNIYFLDQQWEIPLLPFIFLMLALLFLIVIAIIDFKTNNKGPF